MTVNYDPSGAGTSQVNFWLDGTEITTSPLTLTGDVGNNTIPLMIGQRNVTVAGNGSTFDGTIDDLFVADSVYSFEAVPEPSRWALLGGAGASIGFWRRRRKGAALVNP